MPKKENLVNFAIATVVGIGGIITYQRLAEKGPVLRARIVEQITSLIEFPKYTGEMTEDEFLKNSYCPISGRWRFSNLKSDLIAEPGTSWEKINLHPGSPIAKRRPLLALARPADQTRLEGWFLVRTEEQPTGFARSGLTKTGVSIATVRNWLARGEHLEIFTRLRGGVDLWQKPQG